VTAYPAHYLPRHSDAGAEASAADLAEAQDADTAAREHVLALLAASPVYARVARLLGVDGSGPFAAGRSDIGVRLAQLPAGWRVISAPGPEQPSGYVVVGPGGVFAVQVQHHPDAAVAVDGDGFKVNGRPQRCVGEVRRRAARTAKSLSAGTGQPVIVQPVLAVSGAQRGFVIKRQPRGVTVVNRQTVTPFLHAQPSTLDAAACERIAAAAEIHGTAKLKPAFLGMNEEVPYDQIKIVFAYLDATAK